ncbi:hypothetical protein ABID21_000739 [Pseudorhizobium tarimense]|uniref:Uncharacterized protein n=1 Tax=Pseudorhizobium tarimense TaxID=1079109 RepID=A0ABV2H2C3_9HYPH|nr:hypothetical protein [Pseudorhizobium tarimense]MCJ8517748.1 hypothetical protein [Pseudorhizobium tarimense]
MLLPTDAAFGLAATNLMQSTLDSMEEWRKQNEEEATGEKKDPLVEARISASLEARRAKEKIAEALFSVNRVDPNELKMQLTERLAARLGIDLDEERSNYSLGKAIEDAVKELDPTEVAKLEKDLGLTEAGVTLATVIAAIKNPYGDDNTRLMDGLAKIANGGQGSFDVDRVLQRLEDVADPKTLEELKLGPQGYDPTRVEDAEARAERQEDIQALEAAEKLEDVQDIQEAVAAHNDNAIKGDGAGKTEAEPGPSDADMVLLLGATVEQAKSVDSDTDVALSNDVAEAPATDVPSGEPEELNEVNAQAIEEMAAEAATEVLPEVLPITVDEIGLYELLKEKLAA